MKTFFQNWLAAFESKKFKALAMSFCASVVVMALGAAAVVLKIPVTEEHLTLAVTWAIKGIFGTTVGYVFAQGYADAKTGGLTSSTTPKAFVPDQAFVEQQIRSAVVGFFKEQQAAGNPPPVPPKA